MDVISQIQSTTNTTSASQSATTSSAGSVDYDAFLQLLVAQLRNQDPTEPTDNAELMAQLASFSSVEQQIQTNEKLTSLLEASQLSQAGDLIGKTLTSIDGETTGEVSSVILTDDGIVAQLESGQQILVGNGTIISNTPDT